MFPPKLSIPNISKKLLFFGTFLMLCFSGYGQVLTIADVSATEGGNLLFTVTTGPPITAPFTVDVNLTNITAIGGTPILVTPEDFDNTNQLLSFNGTGGETRFFSVTTLDDLIFCNYTKNKGNCTCTFIWISG